MKRLPIVLPTAILLMGCSSGRNLITLGNPTTEVTEVNQADVELIDTSIDSDTGTKFDINDADNSDIEGVDQKHVKLIIENQMTAGQIIVKQVATSRDGWVSIHRSREDGSIVVPEDIGEARVNSGSSEDIVVDLWEAPHIGDKLWALLHIDAGEWGIYEFPGEDLPVRKNGEVMARSFIITDENSN